MKRWIAVGLLSAVACSSSAATPVSGDDDASETAATSSADAAPPDATVAQPAVDASSDDATISPVSGPDAESGDGAAEVDAAFASTANAGSGVEAGNGADGAPESAAPHTFDGTSGKPCTSNADCGSINVCSNVYGESMGTVDGVLDPQLWPTPLCMLPLPTTAGVGNCNPGPQGYVEYCDSANPTVPSSPGICLALTSPQQSGPTNGICFPHCTFAADGSAAVGCPGKDTCNPIAFVFDPATNTVLGHGYCEGTCQVDADCAALGAGWECQADVGYCTKTKRTRSKAVGTLCLNSGDGVTPLLTSDTELGTCNCPFSATTTTAFYCTSACVVGGVACPDGWICDALEPGGPLDFQGVAADGGDAVFPQPKQNTGLAGLCLAPCTGTGAGSRCPGAMNVPPISECVKPTDVGGTLAGPDCLP